MRAQRKAIKLSCRAEYFAWKAKLAHATEIENAVEQTLADVLDFTRCASELPGVDMDHFTGRVLDRGTDGED